MIRNAAAVYGGGGGVADGPQGTPAKGVEVDGDDSEAYASPETWEGGRRDAIVLFGSDRKAKSRRSGDGDDGDDVAGAGATKREHEEANPAPPPSFAKLTKQQRKLKKPCIPRPNVD